MLKIIFKIWKTVFFSIPFSNVNAKAFKREQPTFFIEEKRVPPLCEQISLFLQVQRRIRLQFYRGHRREVFFQLLDFVKTSTESVFCFKRLSSPVEKVLIRIENPIDWVSFPIHFSSSPDDYPNTFSNAVVDTSSSD